MKYARLHGAAARDDADELRAAVADGLDVDELSDGCTALHVAVAAGARRAVAALVELGADVNVVCEENSAVNMVLYARDRAMAVLLLSGRWGAGSKELALFEAVLRDDDAAVEAAGQDAVRKAHGASTTPLMLATWFGSMGAFRALLARDGLGKLEPALGMALYNRCPCALEMAKELLARGADPNAPTYCDQSSLSLAIKSGDFDMLHALASALRPGPCAVDVPWYSVTDHSHGAPPGDLVADTAEVTDDRIVLYGTASAARVVVTFRRGVEGACTERSRPITAGHSLDDVFLVTMIVCALAFMALLLLGKK